MKRAFIHRAEPAARRLLLSLPAACGCLLSALNGGCAPRVQNSETDKPGRVVLRFMGWGDNDRFKLRQRVVVPFEKKHPHIKVELEEVPDQYNAKVLIAMAAGTPPDVMILDASSAAAFINKGVLRDLRPLFESDPEFNESDYFPNVFNIAARGRKVYALPADFTPMVVYYNKRLFDKAGLPYPEDGWTWNDFLRTAKALTRDTDGDGASDQYGFMVRNWMPEWVMWVWQNGSDVLSPDGKRASGYLDSPATIEAVQWFTDLVKKHRVAPSPSVLKAFGPEAFQTGKYAMYISGHWSIPGLKESKNFSMKTVGVVGLPRGKQRATVMYESGFAVPVGSKHPREAYLLAREMSSAKTQEIKANVGLAISSHIEVARRHLRDNPLEPVFFANVQAARGPWGARVESYPLVEEVGADVIDQILIGHRPVAATLRDAARRLDNELNE